MEKAIPWNKIKAEYLQGAVPRELASKYNIDAKTIGNKASANNWVVKKKEIQVKIEELKKQTVDFIQCRCPLNENEDIGSQIIETLVKKREESFREFNLDNMMDVSILHNRSGDDYNVRVFAEEQDRYEDLNLIWKNSCGYLDSHKSWKLKRMEGNDKTFHTCLMVKKVFDVTKCVANFTLKSVNRYDIPMEEAKEKYAKSKVQSK